MAALTITPDARIWMANSSRIRVLHVFENVCTVASESEQVISIVSPDVSLGPCGILVAMVDFRNAVEGHAEGSCRGAILRVGGLEIDTSEAQSWNPRPRWDSISQTFPRWVGMLTGVREILEEMRTEGGLAALVLGGGPRFSGLEQALIEVARKPATAVAKGLRMGDEQYAIAAAAELSGLGVGLTPSGDDWIIGCLLGSWARDGRLGAVALRSRVAEVAAEGTTPLSGMWLRSAGEGKCGVAWHRFFASMMEGEPVALRIATLGIMNQGETSGADALAGLLAMLGWLDGL